MSVSGPSEYSRRVFLSTTIAWCSIAIGALPKCEVPCLGAELDSFKGEDTFRRILAKSTAERWQKLPIGELMGKIARELVGIPYLAGTLDASTDSEACSVNLTGLDCVTFFETTLGLARMIKKGEERPEDLLHEVRFTRYRGGKLGDYSSRLHYTTDWFVDNEEKGVVSILSQLPGAQPFTQKVGFMTSHPESYPQLAAHPQLLEKIKLREDEINRRHLSFVPLAKLAAAEALLRTGDIVGVCTSQLGIDISHTGLILRDSKGIPHFTDASSAPRNMKVTIEPGPISQTLNWSKSITGAMFARPLEP